MYLPEQFAETRTEVLLAALRDAGLFTLVTSAGGLDANHVPLLFEAEPAPLGRLVGHVARASPLFQTPPGSAALAIALGPDVYVTPSWYASKREDGRVVPTWNYVAIHAHGELRVFDDPARLRGLLARLTDRHEASRPAPWSLEDAPSEFVDTLLGAIVGVELTITRLEGKWKVSQNRSAPDRLGVEEGLRREGRGAMADLVRDRGPREG